MGRDPTASTGQATTMQRPDPAVNDAEKSHQAQFSRISFEPVGPIDGQGLNTLANGLIVVSIIILFLYAGRDILRG